MKLGMGLLDCADIRWSLTRIAYSASRDLWSDDSATARQKIEEGGWEG
jgi:hypothetical protein